MATKKRIGYNKSSAVKQTDRQAGSRRSSKKKFLLFCSQDVEWNVLSAEKKTKRAREREIRRSE